MATSATLQRVPNVPNLYHRGGRFYARVTVKSKQTYRALGTTKIREAKKALAALQTGKPMEVVSRKQPALYEAIEQVLEFRKIRRGGGRPLSPATISTHRELANTARRLFPDKQLSQFRDSDFTGPLEASGLSASRRKQCFELVKGAYARAVNLGQIELNPLKGIVPDQVRRKERDLPSREQFDEMCGAMELLFSKRGRGRPVAGGKGAALSARFLAFSGLRHGEALGVDWSHIGGGVIEVYGRTGQLKTEQSRRKVHINPPLQAVLDGIAAIYGKEGQVMPTANLRKYLDHACDHVGIRRLTHHDLRSWFATWAVLAGIEPTTIAGWMGDDVGTVMRIYVQVNDQAQREAAASLQ